MKQRIHSYADGFCDNTKYGRILREMCPVPKERELWDYDVEEHRLSFYIFDDDWNVIFQKHNHINLLKSCETAKMLAVSYCMHR